MYDSIGRLEQSAEYLAGGNNPVYRQTYSYDRFGNRYQKSADIQYGIGYKAVEDTDISKSTNRFASSLPITYDNAGNITTDNKFRNQSYWYDANGRMIRAKINNTTYEASSVYDALGQRVAVRINNSWQHFVYDISGQMVAEYNTQSEGKGAVNYVHKDIQGSTRVVTNQGGWISSRTDYTAFGEEIPASKGQARNTEYGYNANSIREKYALTERDEFTGLDHTDWRKLNTSTGRWTSPDPYKGSMSLSNPQSFNRYSYVGNDPVNLIDPSGLEAIAFIYPTNCRRVGEGDDGRAIYECDYNIHIMNIGGGSSGGGVEVGGGSGGSGTQQKSIGQVLQECVKELWNNTVQVTGFDPSAKGKHGRTKINYMNSRNNTIIGGTIINNDTTSYSADYLGRMYASFNVNAPKGTHSNGLTFRDNTEFMGRDFSPYTNFTANNREFQRTFREHEKFANAIGAYVYTQIGFAPKVDSCPKNSFFLKHGGFNLNDLALRCTKTPCHFDLFVQSHSNTRTWKFNCSSFRS